MIMFDELDELGQFGDGGVDVALLRIEQSDAAAAALDRDGTLRAASVADIVEVDHLADLGQRETDALAAQDPGEPRAIALRIDPRGAAAFGGDQPLILVKAQRTRGDVELCREIGNREMIAIGMTLDQGIGGIAGHTR